MLRIFYESVVVTAILQSECACAHSERLLSNVHFYILQHRERVVGMLTPGMSTSAVACEVNVHCSITSRLQRCTREFGSVSNRPHNHTSPGLRWSETSRPHSCCNSQLE